MCWRRLRMITWRKHPFKSLELFSYYPPISSDLLFISIVVKIRVCMVKVDEDYSPAASEAFRRTHLDGYVLLKGNSNIVVAL